MFARIAKFSALFLAVAVGQTTIPAGGRGNLTIHGRVTDATGSLMPGVEVRATATAIKLPRLVIADESGNYSLARLSPGHYVISAGLPGFVTTSKEIELTGSTLGAVDLVLLTLSIGDCPGPGCGISAFRSELAGTVPQSTEDADIRAARAKAERLVGQMWDFSMRTPAPGNAQLSVIARRQQGITKALHDIGKDAIPAVILALQDPDVQMRRNGALVLLDLAGGFSADARPSVNVREALPVLMQALEDTDGDVRAWAAQTIGEIGPEAEVAVSPLLKLLTNGDEGSRNSSCLALGKIGPAAKDALPALRRALNDPSKDVRRFAEQAIDKIQK